MSKVDKDQHFSGQVTQKALIRLDGKVLLVKYPPEDLAAGMYDMPGGRLHQGEIPFNGVVREVKEETNADVEIKDILTTGVFTNLKGIQSFFVIYETSLLRPSQEFVAEEGEIGEVDWFDEKEFFTLPIIYPEYQKALKPILLDI